MLDAEYKPGEDEEFMNDKQRDPRLNVGFGKGGCSGDLAHLYCCKVLGKHAEETGGW